MADLFCLAQRLQCLSVLLQIPKSPKLPSSLDKSVLFYMTVRVCSSTDEHFGCFYNGGCCER